MSLPLSSIAVFENILYNDRSGVAQHRQIETRQVLSSETITHTPTPHTTHTTPHHTPHTHFFGTSRLLTNNFIPTAIEENAGTEFQVTSEQSVG